MANGERGHVGIELDRSRRIRFDLNAAAEAEEWLGKKFLELFIWNGRPVFDAADSQEEKLEKMLRHYGAREIRALLWAGLRHEDPSLTLRQVGELVELHGEGESSTQKFFWAFQKVFQAAMLYFGGPRKNLGGLPPRMVEPEGEPTPGIGARSAAGLPGSA